MAIETITSKQNELLTQIRKLQTSRSYRHETGRFTADGIKLLKEAVACGAGILAVVYSEGISLPEGIPEQARVCRVSSQLMKSVSDLETPQGVITLCKMNRQGDDYNLNGALILDGIQDPGNLGTLLRTADAMEIPAVILTGACADVYNPKVVRGTMGAVFRLPVYLCEPRELLSRLESQGVRLLASALSDKAIDIQKATLEGCAVVIGSEGSGVSKQLLEAADETVIIPMSHNTESLNAAVAGSIIMWEMRKKKDREG